jgi:hypothetical protein
MLYELEPYLASQICRFLGGSEELCGFLALHVAHLCEVEVAHARAAPYDPVSVVLAQSQHAALSRLAPAGLYGSITAAPPKAKAAECKRSSVLS